MSVNAEWSRLVLTPIAGSLEAKAPLLRDLSIKAYWAAQSPTEAKMAGILLDLFAPDVCRDISKLGPLSG